MSGPGENFLKVTRTLPSGKTYLVLQSGWIHELVTKSLVEVQDCFVGRVEFEGKIAQL